MVEIMAPAGSFESLQAAINAGADSIYFGVEQLNMRARAASNFTLQDLPEIVRRCSRIKTYLTLNTILYDHDLVLMKRLCQKAKEIGITAIIASDFAVMQYARSIGLEVHLSTQANVSNIESVRFFSSFADTIVLARELTLSQIRDITARIRKEKITGPCGNLVKIEVFVHGALCVAISGKCYMSIATYNASANRGACLQNCRRSYKVIDEETGDELRVDNHYIMSPKDLCTIGMVDKLIGAGVSVFKIEGRGKGPEYVHHTVKAYKEAAEAVLNNTYTEHKVSEWTKSLESVYNRGFWENGYYMGKKLGEWSGSYGSKTTKQKVYIGHAVNYYQKNGVGLFLLEAGDLKVKDSLMVTGPTTGVFEFILSSIYVGDRPQEKASKGQKVTFPVPSKVRINDKLFVMKDA